MFNIRGVGLGIRINCGIYGRDIELVAKAPGCFVVFLLLRSCTCYIIYVDDVQGWGGVRC